MGKAARLPAADLRVLRFMSHLCLPMKPRALLLIVPLLFGSLAIARPARAQNPLNEVLNQAICAQDWFQALIVIEEMKRLLPARQAQLRAYQSQLQNLADRNVFMPGWDCAGGGLPSAAAAPPESGLEPQREPITVAPAGTFRVPIKRRVSGIPVVDVTFNGSDTFEMLFDTGASVTKILPSMANQLGLESVGQIRTTVADGRAIDSDLGRLDSVQIGDLIVQDVAVTFVQGTDEGNLGGMGLLGQNIYGNYDVTIGEEFIELRER